MPTRLWMALLGHVRGMIGSPYSVDVVVCIIMNCIVYRCVVIVVRSKRSYSDRALSRQMVELSPRK